MVDSWIFEIEGYGIVSVLVSDLDSFCSAYKKASSRAISYCLGPADCQECMVPVTLHRKTSPLL